MWTIFFSGGLLKTSNSKSAVVSSIILFGVIVLAFQNCSQVEFESVDVLHSGSNSAERILEFKAESKLVPQDIKILLVVDDSYTMSQSQQYLSDKSSILIEALKGRNVELLLTTTSDPRKTTVNSYFVSSDPNKKLNTLTNLPPLREVSASSIKSHGERYLQVYGSAPDRKEVFKIAANMSENQFNAVASAIKQKIKELGVNGNSNETGICPILRHIGDKSKDSFLRDGDRVGVVIITDENDMTSHSNCNAGSSSIISNDQLIYYGLKFPTASIKHTITTGGQDGVGSGRVSEQIIYAATDDPSWSAGYACSTADREKFRKQYPTMISCVYNSYDYPVHFEFKEISSSNVTGFCNQAFVFEGSTYSSVADYFKKNVNSTYTPFLNLATCSYKGSDGAISRTLDVKNEYFGILQKSIIQNLKDLSTARFKDNFFVSALIHRKSQSCQLQAGQSYGSVYESLATLLGLNNAYLHSLCENNYSEPLAQLAGYVSQVQPVLKIETLPGELVSKVSIRNLGSEIVLLPSDFSFSNGTLVIHSQLLNQNSLVRVYLTN